MPTWSLIADAPDADVYLVHGWAVEPEGDGVPRHRWSVAQQARILVPTPIAEQGTIAAHVLPFVLPERVPFQDVWVYANGLFVAFSRLSAPGTVSGVLPSAAFRESALTLTFVLPFAARPVDADAGLDERQLGIALSALEVLT